VNSQHPPRTLPWDWHPGTVPENVLLDDTAYLETTYSFTRFRSREPDALRIGRGATIYAGTMFDMGPAGRVHIGDCALIHGARLICDACIEIGDYALISWNVVLMDNYRLSFDPLQRRLFLEQTGSIRSRQAEAQVRPKPIHIQSNVWIGFNTCVLPGVTIGEGSIIGARSVLTEDVDPYTVVGGNPARVIRKLK
jgi:acetyltransferase-like isoleucine patch superfamily enzyme